VSTSPQHQGHWLRNKADRRTLAFVVAHFSIVIGLWVLNPGGWAAVAGTIALAVSSYQCAVITHNVVHCPLFKVRRWNRLFQVVLTHTYGHPVSTFVPGHNLSHHKYVETDRDVMRTTKVRFRLNILNMMAFYPTVAPAILKNDGQFASGMKIRSPRWYRQLMGETAALVVTSIVLLAIDPLRFVIFWFLPHMFGGWGIISTNLLQHDGCDVSHPANHSRNFTGRFFNWFFVNNGFHGIHHEEPTRHWSLAREAHNRVIKPHIHPNLDQPSMFIYLVKAYVYPGRRCMYDGSPYQEQAKMDDVSWVPSVSEPMPDISLGAEA
jgi:fatty acid desaturase